MEGGQRAAEALTEFAKTFQERNPHLHVFNMVLHMDEATPHLHVDYIPVATGQTRGLSTRVSMKQAPQAAGLYRRWPETDRVEGLDGPGEGSADGDRSAARI